MPLAQVRQGWVLPASSSIWWSCPPACPAPGLHSQCLPLPPPCISPGPSLTATGLWIQGDLILPNDPVKTQFPNEVGNENN